MVNVNKINGENLAFLKGVDVNKRDFIWSLGLFGTAIGAGILFLPISAGVGGVAGILFMFVLAFPMTYFSHKGLAMFVYEGSDDKDITAVADEFFGKGLGFLVTFLYFFAFLSILLVYAVTLTNTVEAFIVSTLNISVPSRVVLSGLLMLILMVVAQYGEELVVKVMSFLVFPFIASILLLGLYLIPKWSGGVFMTHQGDIFKMIKSMFFIIPVMVFAFNHSPIISSMVVAQKKTYKEDAKNHISKILLFAHVLMVAVVVFFVFSCAMTFTPLDFVKAQKANYTILSYIEESFNAVMFRDIAPIIAIIAITKSFFGHYLGTKEGLVGIVRRIPALANTSKRKLDFIALMSIGLISWLVAIFDPNVLSMIELLIGPIIALILFIMPAVSVFKIPALEKYRSFSTYFILVFGILALSAIVVEIIREL
ncbi:aromatic amino acid transport family protein [Hippea alviniae]|uniref:aromatic amino acid transport family protein n=1 Tax=Hippea alviniae TaxID=1279027 RepID=UPI0003B3355F|nr:aromatic amino acid transport family protein [Hippea alviniae]